MPEAARPATASKRRIVLGVIGNDVHVVANRILAIGLEEAGFEVCNLGTNAMPDDFVAAAAEFDADVVLVGSVNGEAEHWCADLPCQFDSIAVGSSLLYVGGNLALGEASRGEVERRFLRFGFDRAFHQAETFAPLFAALAEDLADASV